MTAYLPFAPQTVQELLGLVPEHSPLYRPEPVSAFTAPEIGALFLFSGEPSDRALRGWAGISRHEVEWLKDVYPDCPGDLVKNIRGIVRSS